MCSAARPGSGTVPGVAAARQLGTPRLDLRAVATLDQQGGRTDRADPRHIVILPHVLYLQVTYGVVT
jgi:hypothetical protein